MTAGFRNWGLYGVMDKKKESRWTGVENLST